MKRIFLLFIFLTSILLAACGNKEEKSSKTEDNITKAEKNTTKKEENTAKKEENTTKAEGMDKEILNNGKLPSDKEIKSVAIRDGNTGDIIFEEKENEIVNNIAQKLMQIEFTEYEDPLSTGWRYNLLINNDDMQITVSGNDLIRIRYNNKNICCRTDFDIIGYIENELLGVK